MVTKEVVMRAYIYIIYIHIVAYLRICKPNNSKLAIIISIQVEIEVTSCLSYSKKFGDMHLPSIAGWAAGRGRLPALSRRSVQRV